jgi:hypothetical protein
VVPSLANSRSRKDGRTPRGNSSKKFSDQFPGNFAGFWAISEQFPGNCEKSFKTMHLYAALKLQDLFPQGKAKPVLENPRTIILFEELRDRLAAKEGHSAQQR